MKQFNQPGNLRWIGLTACLSIAAFAFPDRGTLEPIKVTQNVRAVKINTRNFVPQIHAPILSRVSRPKNPIPPIQPGRIGEGNTIPTGEANIRRTMTASPRFPGINFTGWVPPDPNLGAGPRHLVQIVNSSLAFFEKATGRLTFQQTLTGSAGFFGRVGGGAFVFDPKAAYDPVAKRFYVIALDLNDSAQTSHMCVGVSKTDDPVGEWNLYRFDVKLTDGGNSFWMDYPSLGFNKDAIVFCGNMFGFSGGFGGVQMHVVRKAELLTGSAATMTTFRDASAGSAQFARTSDAVLPRVYGLTFRSTTQMRLYALGNLASTPRLDFIDFAIPEFFPLGRDANSLNGRLLDTIDARPYNVNYLNGRLVTAHNARVSASDDRPAARWYEIATGNWPASGAPATVQAGSVVGAGADETHMPAIGNNRFGDITLIFTRSSSTVAADVMIASRKRTDPLGRLTVPTRIDSTPGTYGSPGGNRWGDYFDVTVDPNDGATFWGTAMIGNPDGSWQSTFYKWTVTDPRLAATRLAPDGIRTTQGTGSSGNRDDVRAVDTRTYNVTTVPTTTVGQTSSVLASFTSPVTRANLQELTVNVTSRSSLGATQIVWLFNWNTSRWEVVSSAPMATTDRSISVVVPNPAAYLHPTIRQIRMVVRSNKPNRNGRTADAFQTRLNLVQVAVLARN